LISQHLEKSLDGKHIIYFLHPAVTSVDYVQEYHPKSHPFTYLFIFFLHLLTSRWGLGIFLFTTASRTALGPTQPPIKWVPGALSLGVNRSGREADHSPPSSAEVKNAWSYTSTPPIRLHGVVLSSAQGQLYLPLPLPTLLHSLIYVEIFFSAFWFQISFIRSDVNVLTVHLSGPNLKFS
jgi:hypothetical protein